MLDVGVIGLGEVAQVVHLPVLQSLPELFSVQAGCDISPTLVKEVGARFGIPQTYLTATEMIEAGGLDAVLVLNSDEYHAECVVTALEHGLHVLVEKPMCLSPREAERIIETRDRTAELSRANEDLTAEIARRGSAEADRRELLRRLATAPEDERRHIARELHDQMGQHLAALGLGLKALEKKL